MKTNPYYRDCTEHQLRAAIWNADIGIHWRGPFGNVGELRMELLSRGLDPLGYHEEDIRVETPRGCFRVIFSSIEEAKEVGFDPWLKHNGVHIVTDGTYAFAVKS